MSRILLSLFLACTVATSVATAQLASITFLHDSPDPSLVIADLYVTHLGVTTKIDDISFQSATLLEQVAFFGGSDARFTIAPSNSNSEADGLTGTSFTPDADGAYFVRLHGVREPGSYASNPDGRSTTLAMSHSALPLGVANPAKVGIILAHHATDLEKGDLYVRGQATPLTTNLTYGDVTTTLVEVEAARVFLDYTKAGDKNSVLGAFEADLTLYAGQVIVLTMSGFKTPAENNNSTDTLAMLAVLEDGSVAKYPLQAGSQTARVQFAHASADGRMNVVDVYINGEKKYDNVAYRKATPFDNIPAGLPLVIGFTPAASNSYKDTILTVKIPALRPGRTYNAVIAGVIDTTKYRKNPDLLAINLSIMMMEGALTAASATDKIAVRAVHAATDAGQVTFESKNLGSILGGGRYGSYSDPYREGAVGLDTIWMRDTAADTLIKGYVVNLRDGGKAYTFIQCGFVRPDSNQNGPALKPFLIEPNGTVADNLTEVLPKKDTTSSVEWSTFDETGITVGPNPATASLFIRATSTILAVELRDMTGSLVANTGERAELGTAETQINVSTLIQGAYVVTVRTQDGSVARGLISIAR
jgi:hypothetical protein